MRAGVPAPGVLLPLSMGVGVAREGVLPGPAVPGVATGVSSQRDRRLLAVPGVAAPGVMPGVMPGVSPPLSVLGVSAHPGVMPGVSEPSLPGVVGSRPGVSSQRLRRELCPGVTVPGVMAPCGVAAPGGR